MGKERDTPGTHIKLALSSLVTRIKDTGRRELNQKGTARLNSGHAHGSHGTSIVQSKLASSAAITMLDICTIKTVIQVVNSRRRNHTH